MKYFKEPYNLIKQKSKIIFFLNYIFCQLKKNSLRFAMLGKRDLIKGTFKKIQKSQKSQTIKKKSKNPNKKI